MEMKCIFEQMGDTYTKVVDYYLPDLALPAKNSSQSAYWDSDIYDTSSKIEGYYTPIC